MSTKRAVLLAKGRGLLPSKGVRDDQYNSINLKPHKKCENVKFVQFENFSKDSFNKKDFGVWNGYKSYGKDVTRSLKKNDISKSFGNLCIQEYNQEKEGKKWQNKNGMNNSTLSLHIAAYENGIENQSVDGAMKNEQETLSSKTLKNSFDFPRQFQESMEPEMMQFKASQKLMFHVRTFLKLRCKDCYFVRVNGRLHVECHSIPRHKAREPFNVKQLW